MLPDLPNLPLIERFSLATDPTRYRRIPPDWFIAASDIIGSTGKVQSGRYRDVNFVAAAVIAALQAEIAVHVAAVPACQFGGDGATVAVPPQAADGVRRVLQALAYWADSQFELGLRVGLVPVAELEARGAETFAALYQAGNKSFYGLFLGAGTALAEKLIKEVPGFLLTPQEGPLPGLDGLSCRWDPVPSGRGTVLCLIADPVNDGPDAAKAIEAIRAEIERITPIEGAAPLGDGSRLRPRLAAFVPAIAREMRLVTGMAKLGRLAKSGLEAFLAWSLYHTGLRLGGFTVEKYRRSVAQQTDFRRIATGLRLVLDVTQAEAAEIAELFDRAHAVGLIHYGLHRCEAATITCLVDSAADGRHIHFVDGDGLGFWKAAIDYKSRRAATGAAA
jgi:hypothetical protein